jgi:phage baseplate assembly protein W
MYKDLNSNTGIVKSVDAIKNSIKNILLTPIGSLPGKPEFGSNLYKIVFAPLDSLTETIAKNFVFEALNKFEDRIDIQDIELKKEEAFNKLIVSITFSYKDISEYETSTVSLSLT